MTRTASFFGGATSADGGPHGAWLSFRIIDAGPGKPDRLGFQYTDERMHDGRCGAGQLATSPLLAGAYSLVRAE